MSGLDGVAVMVVVVETRLVLERVCLAIGMYAHVPYSEKFAAPGCLVSRFMHSSSDVFCIEQKDFVKPSQRFYHLT